MIVAVVVTSFGFFPFEFTFLPGMNTKMILAAIGLVAIAVNLAKKRDAFISRDFFIVSLYAAMVSLVGFIATGYNDTSDYSYASYLVSMLVWCASAYSILSFMKFVHGYISLKLLIRYLIVVCVAQCILALSMDFYAPLKNWVDSFLAGEGFMGKSEERLYGLGCSLDVAGTRFGAVLIMLAALSLEEAKENSKVLNWYILSFLIIFVIGNMISRTTIVGAVIALAYWLYNSRMLRFEMKWDTLRLEKKIITALVIFIPILVYLYHHNAVVHQNIQFAFEGFFSLVEKGYWETNSNNRLAQMLVFPESLKTWIIGDGYFNNPLDSDPTYIGPGAGYFYMWTDIGYLRFIFYFGLIGTFTFCIFLYKAAKVCAGYFYKYRFMFFSILLLNYIVWCKVATDLFPVFSLLLVLTDIKSNESDIDSNICN